MAHSDDSMLTNATLAAARTRILPRTRMAIAVTALAFVLVGCSTSPSDAPGEQGSTTGSEQSPSSPSSDDDPAEPAGERVQEETCDWDSPKISGDGLAPVGQAGELPKVLIGSWQHTHTDEGAGFEAVTNDHRFVFSSPDRMLYCQHVPGATDHAENAADVTLNGTKIELPGGKYAYTVTAWDDNTMLWDNPVGGGYVYLLQRR